MFECNLGEALPKAKERIVENASGGAKGEKLANFAKIPPDALWATAERFGIGTAKYDNIERDGTGPKGSNWAKGLPWSSLYNGLDRHLKAFWGGEDVDLQVLDDGIGELLGISIKDMNGGELHMAAAAWHALCLLHYVLNYEEFKEFDDRSPTSAFRK